MTQDARVSTIADRIRQIACELSGSELSGDALATGFFDLGFDSLFLTQLSTRLNKEFKVKLRLRQLTDEFPSMQSLAGHLVTVLPKELTVPQPKAPSPTPSAPASVAAGTNAAPPVVAAPAPAPAPVQLAAQMAAYAAVPSAPAVGGSALERVFAQQLEIMARQLAMLSGQPLPAPGPVVQAAAASAQVAAQPSAAAEAQATAQPAAEAAQPASQPGASAAAVNGAAPATGDAPKPFGAQARIERKDTTELSPRQLKHIEQLIARYNEKTKSSKAYTQKHRARLADPRTVSGFHPRLKEMIYSIVAARSQGSHIWDLDGNDFVDMLCGYGSCYFGHAAPFIVEAIEKQLKNGYEIGPQHHLAGEVAELFCEMVGHDRAAFCNTGSEAVLGAIRMARTITGRDRMVMFTGDYHGINDEVIVRGTPSGRSVPAAAGIPGSHVENVLVLEYGDMASLDIIREQADDIACVVVEPVQSRNPALQPREFLHALRKLTEEHEIAFIMDEVICGFRAAQGGAQEWFGVKADIATYGKVVGGGMPIGVIAGKREYMDALDGGFWQFGDASVPEVGVTYFAGTFVRHPLTLAAAKAVLEYLKREGPDLQKRVNALTQQLVDGMNAFAAQQGVPLHFAHYTSMIKSHYTVEQQFGDLLFAHMRMHGVHIYDGRPAFLTTAHSEADVALVRKAFEEAVYEMQRGGFFVPAETPRPAPSGQPPVPGARLGRDQNGNPAWFVPDPSRPGKYARVSVE